jgi:hypothetical protein
MDISDSLYGFHSIIGHGPWNALRPIDGAPLRRAPLHPPLQIPGFQSPIKAARLIAPDFLIHFVGQSEH